MQNRRVCPDHEGVGEGVPDDYEEEPHRKGDTNWDGSDLKLNVPKWEKA